MKKCLFELNLVALVLSIVFGSIPAQATTYTWTEYSNPSAGSSIFENWAEVANWDGSGVYVSGAANELALLTGLVNAGQNAGSMTITNVPATLSLNTLTLNGQGPNSTIGTAVIVGDNNSTWTIGDGATSMITQNSTAGGGANWANDGYFDRNLNYTIGASLTLNQTTTTFTGNGGGVLGMVFSGDISESAGGYGITKNGSHLLILSGTNTYSGTTTISSGRLRLNNASSLPGGTGVSGGTSGLTISGGQLGLNGVALLRNLGTGSDEFQITGGNSGFSAQDAPGFVSVNDDPATELVWGSASFSPNQLVLNEYRGYATLRLANDIDLSGSRTIVANGDSSNYREGSAVLSGDIGGAGDSLTKSGGGRLVLSGANTYDGSTTISQGTLSVGAANNLGAAGANLVFNGGTLQITGTTLSSFSGIGHTVSFGSGKTVGLDIHDSGNTFTVDQVLNQTTGQFQKYGQGTVVLNQANTYSGNTVVSGGGTLVLDYSSEDNAKISSGALTLSGGHLILRSGTHTQTVSSTSSAGSTGNTISRDGGDAAIDLGTLSISSYSSLSLSEDGVASTSSSTNAFGVFNYGGVTVSSNFAALSGSDIVAYTNYTSYSDGGGGGDLTTVNEWTGGGSLGSSLSSYCLKISNSGDSDVLDIGGNSLFVENYGTYLYAGGHDDRFTINGTGRIWTRNTNRGMQINVLIGILTVNCKMKHGIGGPLAKTGAGTLVAGGANDYSDATHVCQGVFRIANDTGAGTTGGGIFVSSGAALELTNSINVGAETLYISGSGISHGGALRSLSGDNTYGGTLSVRGDGVRINADAGQLVLTGDILASGKDVIFGGAGNITVSNSVVTAGRFTKDGAGSLGVVIDDSSSAQWTCGDTTLNGSTLGFNFVGQPNASVPVIKVLGDLTFNGTPTINITVDRSGIAKGLRFPLITVSGSAPSAKPPLTGDPGKLVWGGDGNRTLYWDTGAQGTVWMVR